MAVVILNQPRPRAVQVLHEDHRRPQVILTEPQRQLPAAQVSRPRGQPVRVFSGDQAALQLELRELREEAGTMRGELALSDPEIELKIAGKSTEELHELFRKLEARAEVLMKRAGEVEAEIAHRGERAYPSKW